ncbi:MAG: hypothetical protein MUE65_06400 [Methanomassiliicoccales archaeon]|jgi:hypothetical protein|nr:hypothetical protein [Methanomassiliicoccales archaeon]
MARQVIIQQCPQCKSTNIFYDLGGVTGRVYRCHDCDYIGPVVIETELTEDEVKALEQARGDLEKSSAEGPAPRKKRFFRRSPE